jgi:hypothetical protein
MFVGYPENHYDDAFRLWDPRSQRVLITCNITWLNKMYFSMVSSNNFDNNTLSIKVGEGDNELLEFEKFVNSPDNNNHESNQPSVSDNENVNDTDSQEVMDKASIDDSDDTNDVNDVNMTCSGRIVRVPSQGKTEISNVMMDQQVGNEASEQGI